MIAGYPWFNDWGRDTLIALPGLALTPKRYDLAKGLLKTFGQYCQQGLIPNAFPDAGTQPFYNSIDAALWWIETLGLYLEATQDWDFLVEQYPIVGRIYKGLMAGTWYNIRVDAVDGLVTWDAPNVALTWMDAVVKQEPVTPRRGKAVEINALWYSALCWAEKWAIHLQQQPDVDTTAFTNQARRYRTQIEQVKVSLQKFWNPAQSYLYDAIAPDDYPDGSIRPNAVIALSLYHCGFSDQMGQPALQVAHDRLLTPYGLRSLDPADPKYVGQYVGGIWQRDRAYHQGSVWSWLLGPFIRAWQRFYPHQPVPYDWQPLIEHFEQQACFHSMSEIFDGDPPHLPRGAIAQAWSVAEMIRHWR
ncbi:amylo-alpha-1,6-glucosidase [Egbenema bharatensis]|uniref:amylo-alpha-1,6-glucosidase n=1 Tax=Egbenema bharatensis TaxID=3463334 RepID=UPI003A84F570